MPLQDRITHAAAVAKWKVDQQARIFKIQNQIHEFENNIRTKKAELAESALRLFQQNQLSEDDLLKICSSIAEVHRQIEEKRSEEELAKREQPPDMELYSARYPSQAPSVAKSGLVCPECGRELVGKFCPVHGVEGIAKSPPAETQSPAEATSSSDQLYCPQCHKPLQGKFCPEHGLEGVPMQSENQ